MTYEDPGWRRVFGRFGGGMLRPWRSSALGEGLDGVSVLRLLFLVFLVAMAAYLFAVFQIVGEGEPAQSWMLWAIAALGIASIVGARWGTSRRLATSSEQELAASYRTNFFIGIAFAEAPALVGFALAIATEALMPFLEGLAFTLVAMWLIAPRRRHIERRQRDVTASGSPLSLGEALTRAYPRPRP